MASRDHPRIRGEHIRVAAGWLGAAGSSPHTRGARPVTVHHTDIRRIIPAYAGSTGTSTPRPASPWDHPRIRGEHGDAFMLTTSGWGSSPHTRGARHFEIVVYPVQRIIPAYAGSTASSPRRRPCAPDHPRIRGEHQDGFTYMPEAGGSSPHTRGALHVGPPAFPGVRIIPAYAGSTPVAPSTCPAPGDHPRIRGEHDAGGRKPAAHPRIIPAYAGST